MKYLFFTLIIIVLSSCIKEPLETCIDGIKNQDEVQIDCGGICSPCAVDYPENGLFGLNLLHGNDTLVVSGGGNSFKAYIPIGSSLKIEMQSISGAHWGYSLPSNVGWSISGYSPNGIQTFDAINGGNTELKIVKIGTGNGIALIKYFENDTIETKRKTLIFQ